MQTTKNKKERRKMRVRAKVQGTNQRPRLSVFRSNKYIYAQLIDDIKGQTLVGVSEKEIDSKEKKTKITLAKEMGQKIAEEAKKLKITSVVFDRGEYAYHGRIKALAEGAREGGLSF